MSKRETAIELLQSNRCMINSCLAKYELKQFNGDFAEYIIRQLSILCNQDKKVKEIKKPESVVLPCKARNTLCVTYSRPKYIKQCKVRSFR